MLTLVIFLRAALPWVLTGTAVAILAANAQRNPQRLATGAAVGLMLGTAINTTGVWDSHIWGILIGPLWGMALMSLRKRQD